MAAYMFGRSRVAQCINFRLPVCVFDLATVLRVCYPTGEAISLYHILPNRHFLFIISVKQPFTDEYLFQIR